jgi:hydroxymethylglutaryl-CoA synthase
MNACEHVRGVEAVFMHRPYQRMPETAWGMAYLFALARGGAAEHSELADYCDDAGIALEDLLAEISPIPDLARFAVRERISDEIFPASLAVLKRFRHTEAFGELVGSKMRLGTQGMRELGNLYTAALPAWLAAGLDEARTTGTDLHGKEVLLLGYGSGDAADAIPITIEPGWQRASAAIDFASSLLPIIDLTHDQYLALRDRTSVSGITYAPHSEFVIDRVGSEATHTFQDAGVEYYRYVQ